MVFRGELFVGTVSGAPCRAILRYADHFLPDEGHAGRRLGVVEHLPELQRLQTPDREAVAAPEPRGHQFDELLLCMCYGLERLQNVGRGLAVGFGQVFLGIGV